MGRSREGINREGNNKEQVEMKIRKEGKIRRKGDGIKIRQGRMIMK